MLSIDIVFYLDSDWATHHRPPERFSELAHRLSLEGKVLCVNRPVSLLSDPFLRFGKWIRYVLNRKNYIEMEENFFLFTPFVLLHDLIAIRIFGLTAINRFLLAMQIGSIIKKHKYNAKQRIAWITDPLMSNYYGLACETIRVYECIDKQTELVPGWMSKQKMKEIEKQACVLADIVFCTASGLYNECKQFKANSYYTPNASDTKLLQKTQDPLTAVNEAVKNLKHPIIGYLGTINEHTDISLLKYIADSRPAWSILMIGPVQWKSFSNPQLLKSLMKMPNVHLTGWLDRAALPGYCKTFDVCVIPYRTDSEFNRFVNPDKLHEYTAMGKPIVSTDIPEIDSHRSIIKVCKDREGIVTAIEESLAEDSREKVALRLGIAKENSWEKRAEEVMMIINNYLAGRKE